MRERVDLKSPVREYRPPGSVRGASGNRRPYLDRKQSGWQKLGAFYRPASVNSVFSCSTRLLKLAECRGLAPLARGHALVSTEARLACPVDIPNWSARQDSHLQPSRFERDASSGWATRGWCPRSDLDRHCARFK